MIIGEEFLYPSYSSFVRNFYIPYKNWDRNLGHIKIKVKVEVVFFPTCCSILAFKLSQLTLHENEVFHERFLKYM